MGIIGNYKNPQIKDADGNMQKSAAEAWSEENGGKDGKATIEQQMKANIKKLKDYKKDLKKAQKEKNQADVDAAQENIDEISKTLSSESSTIQGWIDASKDANGNIIKSMRGSVREWNSVLTDYQNIDLTKAQKNYNNLENYFNSSAGSSMKSYLEDIVKNGGSAQDALDAFRESGMRLNDIGVNSSTFLKYFEEVKKSAEEAADAVNQVDGSFDGMKTASESANQGVNYDSTMGYYKTAKEAYSKGLWGTDDFQTVAQFSVGYDISKKLKENADAYTYASDAYKEAWENGGSQLMERWYGNEDELVNITHVLEDFKKVGLASSNGNGEWLFKNSDGSMKFKTTAEAAEKLHTSVDNVEVAMSKLEEHGFEFDGIEKSGKLLNDYKDRRLALGLLHFNKDGSGYEGLSKFLRGHLQSWKTKSMENCNYQCVLTGSKDFAIHHMYGFANILNETIEEYNIELKEYSEYTIEELEDILEKFLEVHDKYPLGVCVRKDIHTLYHSVYSKCVNNEEQWNQFVKEFKDGVYDDRLKIA